MALILADRVKESTTTTGASDFVLSGASTGFQTFAAGVGANNTTYYAVSQGSDWEVGLGTLSSDGLTLARTTVLQSSNSDTKVSFSSGSKEIFVTYAADKAVFEDASGNVTLPANLTVTGGSTTDSVQLDLTAGVTSAVGQIAWDAAQGTASLGLLGGNVISRVGQSLVAYVTNAESVTITKGQAVYLFSAQGDRATVKLANNTGDSTSAKTLGIVAEDITANGTGFVVCQGVVYGLNLSAFTAGDTIYLGATAGALTATKPYAPNHLVYLGVVEKANAGAGQLYVRVQNGYELDELHNVSAQSPSNGQTIVYNSSTSLWEKNTVSLTDGVNGTLPATNGGTGQSSYAVGDIVYASTTTALSKLADVATGNALISGGIGVAPSYGKIGLTTHVSGTLPTANGGTNLTTFTSGGAVYATSTSALTTGTLPITAGGTGATTLAGASIATYTGTETLTNKTFTGYTETIFAVSGTTPALSPTNGTIQTWTLSANSTPTSGTWANGQSLTLMIDDGSAFTITWTSLAVTWKTNTGSAPTLNTTGFTAIQLWKVGNVVYGARVGDS